MNSRKTTGALLLAGGIAIGIGLTVISMNAFTASKAASDGAGQVVAAEGQMVAERPAAEVSAQPPAENVAPPAPAQAVENQSAAPQAQAYNPFVQSNQNAAPSAVPQQANMFAPTMTYTMVPAGPVQTREIGTTVSGYPIEVGTPTRAIDSAGQLQPMGSNGLLQNPCVDPPSVTVGRAYNAPQ